jgi:hypothetical protein
MKGANLPFDVLPQGTYPACIVCTFKVLSTISIWVLSGYARVILEPLEESRVSFRTRPWKCFDSAEVRGGGEQAVLSEGFVCESVGVVALLTAAEMSNVSIQAFSTHSFEQTDPNHQITADHPIPNVCSVARVHRIPLS